jgi:murein tripeptide amidase MpaA
MTRSQTATKFLLITSLFFIFSFSPACSAAKLIGDYPNKSSILEQAYERYREASISERRFKYDSVIGLVTNRKGNFEVEPVGKSVAGKPVYKMTIGTGSTKVMLWSQMHGNESTATMALFDIFNFLEGKNDGFDNIRNTLLENLTLRFIPMVNPDGMDEWTRRNALDIDLNRDALALASPEAVLLMISPRNSALISTINRFTTPQEKPGPPRRYLCWLLLSILKQK